MSSNEVPPAYDFTSGANLAEKGNMSVPPASASTSGASMCAGPHSRALEDGGPPTSFHVYKEKMLKSNDRVTGDDKDKTL